MNRPKRTAPRERFIAGFDENVSGYVQDTHYYGYMKCVLWDLETLEQAEAEAKRMNAELEDAAVEQMENAKFYGGAE